jgi:hypothetical protein
MLRRLSRSGKLWTINGAISDLYRKKYFYLDPSNILLPKIFAGEYIMLYGARASGKTTRAYAAQKQLGEYSVLDSSFQTGVNFDNKNVFWKSFGKTLYNRNPEYNLPPIHSAIDFANMFASQNLKTVFKGKPVVLLIDEFDILNYAKSEIIDSVLRVFRGLKHEFNTNCLHSVVAIGPFSILQLNNESGSPFNPVQSPNWTLEEVATLFQQFEKERGIKLDSRIIEDIFTRTGGHAGLICLCGKAIDDILKIKNQSIRFEDWIEYAIFYLKADMDDYPTMRRLSDILSEKNPQMKSCVEMLYRSFLPIDGSVEIDSFDTEDLRICQFLTSEGALRHNGRNSYSIPCPLIRTLLFDRVVRKLTARPLPSILPPLKGDHLDMNELLKISLLSFDGNFIYDSVRSSSNIFNNENVPQAAAYQAELERILTMLASSRYFSYNST